ncbi:MAG: S-adenosylmethionine:tRNA ribosyltransferase-isomerase [Prevotellaceae bacterium]|jgi:S-adenosylmethionine:tRNA ribosyltransferase-isomerase|nr:S-adenosylmethionine:tRNA ribosyltransferase-isomerase [Prevotellaceae bacterium]
MLQVKKNSIEEYNYSLPDEKIAKFPLEKRDESKLLLYENNSIAQSLFKNIADFLPGNALMVFNNTKVIQARLYFQKTSGARIEIFCLEPHDPSDYILAFQANQKCVWKCMVGNAKKWKEETIGKNFTIEGKSVLLTAKKISSAGNTYLIEFSWNEPAVTFAGILENAGQLPIPPYLHRETCEQDKETYQTVYSKIKGSVAAPTAGLHFTGAVFESLKKKNIECEEVTLHVGAGTFQPVKSKTIDGHEMHTEFFSVRKETIARLKEKPDNIIAVGTTSVRTLESLYYIGLLLRENPEMPAGKLKVTQWMPYGKPETLTVNDSLQLILNYLENNNMETLNAETQIMIVPGYRFKIIKGIVTNFHQPQSTLLLLISAFAGEDWKRIYDYALKNDFRFLSYGDSSLLL